MMMTDREIALRQYRLRARFYDLEVAAVAGVRRRAIARLALEKGDVVLDLGCGTGLSFASLEERIGTAGRVIGIEQSPEMLVQARRVVERHRWRNVELILSPVEEARIPGRADAALFFLVHDIMRTPRALANVAKHLRPGARVVAVGIKWARWWAWPANLLIWLSALHSTSTCDGLGRPWDLLAEIVPDLRVESLPGGWLYFASGHVREVP